MKIDIIAVGKLKEKYLKIGMEEYLKRLQSYAKVKVWEVPDEKTLEGGSLREVSIIQEKEAERIVKKIPEGAQVIALDIQGKMLTSEELSETFQEYGLRGKSHWIFIIGGSLGLSKEILQRADLRLSFSKMTFPHQLMRLILLEQIYRGFKILKREPYHK
ncbi:23S rRNA (pseudouridine(1915)-N(3))-methyltransferase RlmH [Isachenkonia alkalipeptolytica]|uniref:Ribosomal RNA large subunit methyltransferase H n=1 Tax=Isachenkonia alkalipeptolytica TaxID=2565777 RepID=A0AA43XKT0_9CLOT|nr:23S rRNA (pseudouridine(1915)-N(3))-methyltransferase RlmH [Isachenkonia alkalipeptolytica]NBG88099.1 23S rRNA (pseudouridine(1915)-N(3))-methyltransferase RlmH [Isachenkonia alkalipeptolytica]